MRKGNLLVAAALLVAVAFTSCNVNDEIQDNTAVRFTAGIGQQAVVDNGGTRAAGTDWAASDAIGIFMMNGATVKAANKQYKVSDASTGTFTAELGNEMYYPLDGSQVGFISYYPYKLGMTLATPIDVTIGTTQTDATQPDFDLLYSDNATGYSKTSTGAAALNFEHKLSKMVMNIVQPSTIIPNNTGLTDADLVGMTVKINGMNTKNTFNLATGALGDTPGTPLTITPRTVTDGSAYDAIIMPGSYGANVVTVEFTIKPGTADAETFTWNVGATSFEGGNEYTYAVNLTRTGVSVTGTITPWIPNNMGGVDAE